MAERIADWPHFPDPRPGHLAVRGSNCLAAAPWKWFAHCPTATGVWDVLNNGVVITYDQYFLGEHYWKYDFPFAPLLKVFLKLEGRNESNPFPNASTIRYTAGFQWFLLGCFYEHWGLAFADHLTRKIIRGQPGGLLCLVDLFHGDVNFYPCPYDVPEGAWLSSTPPFPLES